MTQKEIASYRLRNQQICGPGLATAKAVVQWMGAVQAQDYLASLWAIGLRTSQAGEIHEQGVEQAITDRKIVRTWPMRGTLHFVAAPDARWMLRLLTPRVIRSSAPRYRELELDERVFSRSRNILEQALQGNQQLMRAELYQLLEAGGISTQGQRGIHIVGYLAQTGVICFGSRQGKQHTFTLLDEWIGPGHDYKGDEALAELARRYILSHGPATAYDFSAWAGLTLIEARKALSLLEPSISKEEFAGKTYWYAMPKDNWKPPVADSIHLLPAFDEILCGYKDRSAVLTTDYLKSIILKNGILMPTIMIDGKVAGSWKRTLKKEKVEISLELFLRRDTALSSSLKSEAERYGNFLGLQTELKAD